MNEVYATIDPARSEIDKLDGPTVIEFGSPWCGYCRAAQPLLAAAFAGHPRVRHIRRLPTPAGTAGALSFGVNALADVGCLKQGKETARLVRPTDSSAIRKALEQIDVAE